MKILFAMSMVVNVFMWENLALASLVVRLGVVMMAVLVSTWWPV